jgi:hypothetical protein
MDWLRQNGFWVLIFVIFVAAHLFGHGGHGGHGSHGGDNEGKRPPGRDTGETKRPAGHQH